MSSEAGLETEEVTEQPVWSRWVIIGGTLLAVLLIGGAAGMFLTRAVDEPAATATPATGSVEVGFAQDMSTHHLQAVTMAGVARDRTTDPEIRQLAFDIERTQLEQVGRMKGWLMLWDQPEQAIGAPMKWMTEPMSGHDGMSMAQYASQHSNLPALKALVNSILASQGAEMDQMKLMLTGRGAQPLP